MFDQKKIEILTLYPRYYGMVKKTISRYCPLSPVATGSCWTFVVSEINVNLLLLSLYLVERLKRKVKEEKVCILGISIDVNGANI